MPGNIMEVKNGMNQYNIVKLKNKIKLKKMKWSTDTCYNTNEPPKHYPKWKKLDTQKDHIQYHMLFHLYEISRIGKCMETNCRLTYCSHLGRKTNGGRLP